MRRQGGNGKKKAEISTPVRVAIYTRKSVADGLDQEFTSLDAQREAVEAYIQIQKSKGWMALPERYDDGGFTGANTNRPAFQSLLQDIKAGKIDLVAVYKYDRLSRSLLDFLQILNFFNKHDVDFVSVTQNIDTTTGTGRLLANILMSFSEYEREAIADRTRDKMGAARKKGLWTGGRPLLGYDVQDKKLVVNKEEALQVKQIFKLYLELGSLRAVVEELNRRGWKTKTYTTKGGRLIAGKEFDKNTIQRILTSSLYIGKVEYGGKLHNGAHKAILNKKTWQAVQDQLEEHRRDSSKNVRNKWGALLKGLIQCGVCGSGFSHHYSKRGNRRYSYYVCETVIRKGAPACPGSRIPAGKIEQFVVDRIRDIGKDPRLISETVAAMKREMKKREPELKAEIKQLDREVNKLNEQRKNIMDTIAKGQNGSHALLERLGEIDDAFQKTTLRIQHLRREMETLKARVINEDDMKVALASFTPVWDVLYPREQERILRLLIESITYNGQKKEVEITFRPGGIQELAAETEEVTCVA